MSCMVLGIKPMRKLITCDNYLGTKQNPGQLNEAVARTNPQKVEPRSCMVLGLKPMEKLITLDKYLSVRQNQVLAWSSDSNLWEN